jgi:hypothetical protein
MLYPTEALTRTAHAPEFARRAWNLLLSPTRVPWEEKAGCMKNKVLKECGSAGGGACASIMGRLAEGAMGACRSAWRCRAAPWWWWWLWWWWGRRRCWGAGGPVALREVEVEVEEGAEA